MAALRCCLLTPTILVPLLQSEALVPKSSYLECYETHSQS
jgi:hypothetical protein